MKRFLPFVAACGVVCAAQAEYVVPTRWQCDFSDAKDASLPAGWLGRGVDAKTTLTSLFDNYSAGNAFSVLAYGSDKGAFSPSEFVGGGQSDQWLISPEIEITSDADVLTYTVAANGNTVLNKYAVYISEGGTEKADFENNLLFSGTLRGSIQQVASTDRAQTIAGYKGKKVRLAFVSAGNSTGLVGFGGFTIGSWYFSIANPDRYLNIWNEESADNLSFSIDYALPADATEIECVLSTPAGKKITKSISGNFSAGRRYTKKVEFELAELGETDYTITFTPNIEGLSPASISGHMTTVERKFPATVVLEEQTGSWCQYCPMGIAYMNYYHDKYTGADGGPRVFGAALHYGDAMVVREYYEPYSVTLGYISPTAGFPHILANRNVGMIPSDENVLNGMLARGNFANLTIDKGTQDENGNITLDYTIEPAFESSNTGLRVAAAVIENDFVGNSVDYNQSNAYYTSTYEAAVRQLGEEIAKYLKPFLAPAGMVIPFSKMVYQEVARGIFPSYDGASVGNEWKNGSKVSKSITFSMPENVKEVANTEVIVMLVTEGSNEIIAADRCGFNMYAPVSVDEITGHAALDVRCENGNVIAETPAPGVLRMYGIDGGLLLERRIEAGRTSVALTGLHGMVVARLETAEESRTAKFVVR